MYIVHSTFVVPDEKADEVISIYHSRSGIVDKAEGFQRFLLLQNEKKQGEITVHMEWDSKVFSDYALWLNSVLVSRGMKSDHLIDNFKCIIESLEMSGVEKGEYFKLHLNEAIKSIQKADRENMPAN